MNDSPPDAFDAAFGSSSSTSTPPPSLPLLPQQNNPGSVMTTTMMPPERFKDLCLRKPATQEINAILDQFFDPEKPLNVSKQNDVETLQSYLTGGISFESFKAKC
jgi:hypothetical protein